MAAAEAPVTVMFTLAFSSPRARRRTPSFLRRSTPASTKASSVISALTSIFLLSIAFCRVVRLIQVVRLWFSALKPRFGMRMWRGIWPPSNPLIETPRRDFCPFTPRPPVLPLPEPTPRPTRISFFVLPGLSFSSLSFIVLLRRREPSLFHDFDEVVHFADHALHRRRVLEFNHLLRALEAKPQQRRALASFTADGAADAAQLDLAASGLLLRSHLSTLRRHFAKARAVLAAADDVGDLEAATVGDLARRALVLQG